MPQQVRDKQSETKTGKPLCWNYNMLNTSNPVGVAPLLVKTIVPTLLSQKLRIQGQP